MRVAFVADVHARASPGEPDDSPRIHALFRDVAEKADALVLAGDLTDHGRPAEMEALVRGLDGIAVPVLAVLGNHDHESGSAKDIARVLDAWGVTCLQGGSVVLDGVGFAGVKGFGGGFEGALIRGFGEDALKAFVSESVVEAEALRGALNGLDAKVKVAVTHYAPVPETLAGEPLTIHAFLGTSRLAGAIDQGGATLAVHGHAHHGALQGRTGGGVPVWNVSLPVLRAAGLDAPLVLDVG